MPCAYGIYVTVLCGVFQHFCITICLVSTAVTIGLQQSYYFTMEDQGPVEICIMVLSGDITGKSYIISYSTIAVLAEGNVLVHVLCLQLYYFVIHKYKHSPK